LAAIGQIRTTIHDIDKSVPISEVQTMDQVVEEATGESQFYLLILVAFASLALLLAAIGIYGVMSYSVSLRTREIGIRVALGAERHHVMGMVIRRGLIMAAYCIAAGIAGALMLTRFMSTILYQTTPQDPATYVIVVFLLIATALLASYLPARRATKVDPMEALRYE
jgi:putative ABC transport system permease protein